MKAVTLLHGELVRLNALAKTSPPNTILTPQELITMALTEEERVALAEPLVYSNVIKHRITAYKKMTLDDWLVQIAIPARTPKQDAPDRNVDRRSAPQIDTGLTPEEELQILPHLISPAYSSLFSPQNGFITSAASSDEIQTAMEGVTAALHTETCDRCGSRFRVFPGRRETDGALTSGGSCTHHPGKALFPLKLPGAPKCMERVYTCCQQPIGQSSGCTTAEMHVFKVTDGKRLAAIEQFVATPSSLLSTGHAASRKPKARALAIDCEMSYTTAALTLVRLTATSFPGRTCLLDVLVRPQGEVLDLNSRFSGVFAEDLASAIPWDSITKLPPPPAEDKSRGTKIHLLSSTTAARALLFQLIDSSTYVIGHGLENDLTALRIIHPPDRLVDTALLFRHPRGLPFRYGLKMLVARHLQRDIQVADGNGHDSKEDARAAGDLVRWKIGKVWEDMKRQGWTWGLQKATEGEGEAWVLKPPVAVTKSREQSDGEEIEPPPRKKQRTDVEQISSG